jgi:hypothetical protein
VESHTVGQVCEGSFFQRAVGTCPEATVTLGSKEVRCLLDTGAQVSTVTESFFLNNLAEEADLWDVSSFIRISAANGGDIPFVGYLELNLTVFGQTFPNMGFLVVKDPLKTSCKARRK